MEELIEKYFTLAKEAFDKMDLNTVNRHEEMYMISAITVKELVAEANESSVKFSEEEISTARQILNSKISKFIR